MLLRDNDNGLKIKSPNDETRCGRHRGFAISYLKSTIDRLATESRVLSFLLLNASKPYNRQAYLHLHSTSREDAVTQRNRFARERNSRFGTVYRRIVAITLLPRGWQLRRCIPLDHVEKENASERESEEIRADVELIRPTNYRFRPLA